MYLLRTSVRICWTPSAYCKFSSEFSFAPVAGGRPLSTAGRVLPPAIGAKNSDEPLQYAEGRPRLTLQQDPQGNATQGRYGRGEGLGQAVSHTCSSPTGKCRRHSLVSRPSNCSTDNKCADGWMFSESPVRQVKRVVKVLFRTFSLFRCWQGWLSWWRRT